MKKSKRMQVVLELAERNESQALEVLNQARQNRDAQQAQLLNLQNYHQQYLSEMRPAIGGVASAQQLQSSLQFVTQIDQAIEQQRKVLEVAENKFQFALSNWQQCHQKKKGLADLIDRYKAVEQIEADKSEQKMLEDLFLSRQKR